MSKCHTAASALHQIYLSMPQYAKFFNTPTTRYIHHVRLDNVKNKPSGTSDITYNKQSTIGRSENKTKKPKEPQKLVMKEWSEQIPSWLNREKDDSDLVKHIEVLQRFADRYNAAYGNVEGSHDKNSDNTGANRKKILNVLDNQPSKKYSTLAGEQRQNKKLNVDDKHRTGFKRSFITLEKEPPINKINIKRSLVPRLRPNQNPDSFKFPSLSAKANKRKLHAVIKPIIKKKTVKPSLKKYFVSNNKEEIKPQGVQDVTINDYYGDRYVPKTKNDFKLKKPTNMKGNKDLNEWSTKFKETLVQNRKSTTSSVLHKAELKPMIHPKTSLLVKQTHLPLQLCKNMKSTEKVQETTQKDVKVEVPPAPPDKPKEETKIKREKFINRLMKYFRN